MSGASLGPGPWTCPGLALDRALDMSGASLGQGLGHSPWARALDMSGASLGQGLGHVRARPGQGLGHVRG